MIFISGVINIIIQKNTLCTSKVLLIYFCPNCVNFLPENVQFFLSFFLKGAAPQLVRLCSKQNKNNCATTFDTFIFSY